MNPGLESHVLVYDVGGSHVSAAIWDAGQHRLGPVARSPHPDEQSTDVFVEVLHSLAIHAAHGIPLPPGAAVAMPGPFDYATGVSWMRHKLPYLYGVNLGRVLAQRFAWEAEQVLFLNDAAAFLMGEVAVGAARNVHRAVGITLGTGIGSAFAVDGRIVAEGPGIPAGGEIWNLPYQNGIVEDLLSAKAIQQSYLQRTGSLQEVAVIAAGAVKDQAAAGAFEEFGQQLGLVLRSLFSTFGPDVVVLGGGISRSADLFLTAAKHQLQSLSMELRVSELGDKAQLAGAGCAWFEMIDDSSPEPAHESIQADAQA